MSDSINTIQDLLRHWRERADTLAQTGRREASEERLRCVEEAEAYLRELTARMTNDATEGEAQHG